MILLLKTPFWMSYGFVRVTGCIVVKWWFHQTQVSKVDKKRHFASGRTSVAHPFLWISHGKVTFFNNHKCTWLFPNKTKKREKLLPVQTKISTLWLAPPTPVLFLGNRKAPPGGELKQLQITSADHHRWDVYSTNNRKLRKMSHKHNCTNMSIAKKTVLAQCGKRNCKTKHFQATGVVCALPITKSQ